jgi:fatty acid desaturase
MRGRNLWTITLFILIAIGAWSVLAFSPQSLIIPAIVVGVVLFLYFFPPQRWRVQQKRDRTATHRSSATRPILGAKKPTTKKRNVKLRIIQGSKKDDDEEPPLIH